MKFLRKPDENAMVSFGNEDELVMPLSRFKSKQAMYARAENQMIAGTPKERLKILVPLLAVPFSMLVMQMSHGATRPFAPLFFFGVLGVLAWFMRAPLSSSSNTFTHLLVSDKGVRLHKNGAFAGAPFMRWFNWTSPVIPWEAITYADTAPAMLAHSSYIFGNYAPPPEWLNFHNGTTLRLHVNMECMPILDARKFSRGRKQSKATLLLITDALAERDIVQIVSHLRRHLPKESIHETADAYAPAQLWQDYTTIWLQQLNDNSRVATLPSGTVLKGRDDSYEIIERLGSGGQAVTYTAKKSDGEVVVLKEFVLPSTGGQEVVRNTMTHITKEAQLLQSLDHPQIVKCHGWFSSGRRAYLALSLLEGKTLRQLVKDRGPAPEATVRHYAKQMCELLQYLHSMSPPVVHRDFTPDNLMVNDKGQLFLMDFDVARHLESQTATRTVVGKHNYMPPEQFRGQATTESDLYALGCTLHWLLTGQDPEPISVCHPQKNRPELSDQMEEIVAKATAQDTTQRYQSARQIFDSLAKHDVEVAGNTAIV